LISQEDQLLLIDQEESKEIRDSTIEDSSDKIIIFNQSLSQLEDIEDVYNLKFFKIRQLSISGKMNISDPKFHRSKRKIKYWMK